MGNTVVAKKIGKNPIVVLERMINMERVKIILRSQNLTAEKLEEKATNHTTPPGGSASGVFNILPCTSISKLLSFTRANIFLISLNTVQYYQETNIFRIFLRLHIDVKLIATVLIL